MDTSVNNAPRSESSDQAILELSEHRIRQRTFRKVRGLKVIALDGYVVVQGVVSTYYVKQLAVEAAREALRWSQMPLRIDIHVS